MLHKSKIFFKFVENFYMPVSFLGIRRIIKPVRFQYEILLYIKKMYICSGFM